MPESAWHWESSCYRGTERGSDEMGSVIPGRGMAVTYLTSSSLAQRFSVFTLEHQGCWGTIPITLSRSLENLSMSMLSLLSLGLRIWLVMPGCNLSIIWGRGTMTQDALLTSQAPGGRADISWDPGSGSEWQLMSVQAVHVAISTREHRMRCGDHGQWLPAQNITYGNFYQSSEVTGYPQKWLPKNKLAFKTSPVCCLSSLFLLAPVCTYM